MKHTYIIVPFILLSACGSQQSSSEPSVPSESSIQSPSAVPSPVSTITVDQDANVTVAPGPVQPTSPVIATPLPDGVTPTPAQPNGTLTVFATPIPEPTPTATPTPTQCAQKDPNGLNNYACGYWTISSAYTPGEPYCHNLPAGLWALDKSTDGSYITSAGTLVRPNESFNWAGYGTTQENVFDNGRYGNSHVATCNLSIDPAGLEN